MVIKRSNKALFSETLLLIAPYLSGFIAFALAYIFFLKFFISLAVFLYACLFFLAFFSLILVGSFIINKRVWVSKEYILTPETVTIADGSWGAKYRSFSLKGLTNTSLAQSLLGKSLNYGTITLYFLGGNSVNLTNIADPIKHMDDVNSLLYKGYIELTEEEEAGVEETEKKENLGEI